VRVVEIRLLEGPNVYRDDPTVKVEVAVGRRRSWYGKREPGRHALVRLGAPVPARDRPDEIALLVAWCRRLRVEAGEGVGGVAVHRSSDPGHWVVAFPWTGAERSRVVAEAAVELTAREVSAGRRATLTGAQARLLERARARIAGAGSSPASWIRDADRRVPIVSISGTNGKSTVTTLVAELAAAGGRRTLAGGNLGEPALDLLEQPRPELYVLELSSFQLETTHTLHTVTSTVLNLTPDHMDRYASMEEYGAAKARIFDGCDVAVINAPASSRPRRTRVTM